MTSEGIPNRFGELVKVHGLAFIFALSGMLAAAPVHAGQGWGLEFGGGWSHYSMGSFNDSLRSFNRTAGTNLESISDGGTLGVGLRFWRSERLLFRLSLEKLDAKSVDGELEFDVGCRALSFGATRYFPTENPVRFGLGAGLGWYHLSGNLGLANANATGDGIGAHLTAETSYSISRRWSLCGTLGYRFAAVNHIVFNDDEQTTDLQANYSGPLIRLSLAADFH